MYNVFIDTTLDNNLYIDGKIVYQEPKGLNIAENRERSSYGINHGYGICNRNNLYEWIGFDVWSSLSTVGLIMSWWL